MNRTLSTFLRRLATYSSVAGRLMPRMLIDLMSLDDRLAAGFFKRTHYAFLVNRAVRLARALGHEKVSVLEFGVAGGNGLLLLEEYAELFGDQFGIQVEVYGFDNGSTGMPSPIDYRDCPHVWKQNFYQMDVDRLKNRIRKARLLIGDVATTLDEFAKLASAPVGGISFDLDFWSSTKNAFRIFDLDEKLRLPRIICYFDDVIGGELDAMSEDTGELLAIAEYNDGNIARKIRQDRMMMRMANRAWDYFRFQMYQHHDYRHSQYTKFVGTENDQRPLG